MAERRFGSIASLSLCPRYVRFHSDSDQISAGLTCPDLREIITRAREENGESIAPKAFETIRGQRRIPRCVLDIPMTQVRLERPGIDAVIGELETGRMSQHVCVRVDA